MRYYIVKKDDTIQNSVNINMTKEELEKNSEKLINCDLSEDKLKLDYTYIRKLFSNYHILSDRFKELLEIYDDTLNFKPLFLCDLENMQQYVYWQCSCNYLDCYVNKEYNNPKDIILKKDLIKDRFLFKVSYQKQDFFIFELALVENILRKEFIGMEFLEVENIE